MTVWEDIRDQLSENVRDGAREASPPVRPGEVKRADPLTVEVEGVLLEEGDPDVEVSAGLLDERPSVGDMVLVHTDEHGDYYVDGSLPSAALAVANAATSRVAVVEEAPLNAAAKGLKTDGTNQAAKLAELAGLMPANGGKMLLPRGVIRADSWPSMDEKRSITVMGEGGRSGGAGEASRIVCTRTDGAAFISVRSSFGITFEDVSIFAESASYTGKLLNADQKPAGLDTQFLSLRRVTLAANGAGDLLSLVKAVNGCFDEVNFKNAAVGVRGQNADSDYSVAHLFKKCRWGSFPATGAPVLNVDESWTFEAPTAQQRTDGSAAFIRRDVSITTQRGLTIKGMWCGDSSAGSGTWIEFAGAGLSIEGGVMGHCAVGIDAGAGGLRAVNVHGVVFSGASVGGIPIAIRLSGGQRHHIAGNEYHDTVVTMPVVLTTMPAASFIMGRNGLVAPLPFEDAPTVPAPVANTSNLGARLNGANQELNWKADNGSLKTIVTE